MSTTRLRNFLHSRKVKCCLRQVWSVVACVEVTFSPMQTRDLSEKFESRSVPTKALVCNPRAWEGSDF